MPGGFARTILSPGSKSAPDLETDKKEDNLMALSDLFSWGKSARAAASSACGAGDKPDETPAACGAGDKPAACGCVCGAGGKT